MSVDVGSGNLTNIAEKCGLKTKPPGGFVGSPDRPKGREGRRKFLTECTGAREENVKYPG